MEEREQAKTDWDQGIKWHLITPEYIISPAELRDLEKRANGAPNHLSD